MSRGDDSDEEVYLSDPSDDEEAKSVDDYEFANDGRGGAGYEQASPQPAAADIDYALHDAEAERAALRGESPKISPAAVKSTPLSPNAAPWTPSGHQPAVLATADDPADKLEGFAAAIEDLKSEPQKPAESSNGRTEAAAPRPASPPPAVQSQKEAPDSPIDVQGMLDRAAARQSGKDAPAAANFNGKSGATKIAAVEDPKRAATEDPETDAAQGVKKLKTEPVSPAEGARSAKSETPAASAPSYAAIAKPPPTVEKKEEQPESSKGTAPTIDEKEVSEKPMVEAEADAKPAGEERERAATQPADEDASGSTDPGSEEAEKKEAPAPTTRGESSSAPIDEQPKSKGSAMPALPERKRPGSAMPTLPARPTRRPTAAPTPAPAERTEEREPEEEDEEDESRAAPQAAEAPSSDSSNANARTEPAAQQPAQNPATQQPPANGQGGRPPANGQRGPALLQRINQPPQQQQQGPDDERTRDLREQLKELQVLLGRASRRLDMPDHNIINHVRYRLGLAERIRLGASSNTDDSAQLAKEKEEENPDEELMEITVLVIGLSGSGKSSTINSLLGFDAVPADPLEGTRKVTVASGTVFGLQLRFIDTPGLHAAAESSRRNASILKQIDNARKKYKPKLVIYCDRLDTLRRDLSDIPVLRQITETLGSEVWFNTVLVLTHAASPGPLGLNGQPLPYSTLTETRAVMLARAIQAAVGDSRISSPSAFAENSPTCSRNAAGEALLPSGQPWRRFLLMWILAMRVLAEADSRLDVLPRESGAGMSSQQRLIEQLFNAQRGQKLPPLQYLVPNMIRHAGPKQYPDVEREVKREDELRAIKDPEKRRQENRKRTEYLKAKHQERQVLALPGQEEAEIDPREGPSAGPPLAPTFDCNDHSHLYRAFEPKQGDSAWLVRARLDQNCFDHTDGYDSLTTERTTVFRRKGRDLGGVPAQAHAIVQKDKNTTLLQTDAEASFYQRYNLVHTGRAQFLTLNGGDLLYVSQLESQLCAPLFNRMTLGGMVARLGEDGAPPTKGPLALGYKMEEDLDLPEIPSFNGKHGMKVGIARAQVKLQGGRTEKAIGWNGEYQLTGGKRENIQVVGSVSQMEYRGNKGRQYTLSGAVPVTSETVVAPKIQYREGQGSLNLRITSHDHHNIGLVVLVPLVKSLLEKFSRKGNEV